MAMFFDMTNFYKDVDSQNIYGDFLFFSPLSQIKPWWIFPYMFNSAMLEECYFMFESAYRAALLSSLYG